MSKASILAIMGALLLAPVASAQNPTHKSPEAATESSCVNKAKGCAKAIQREKALIRKANQSAH